MAYGSVLAGECSGPAAQTGSEAEGRDERERREVVTRVAAALHIGTVGEVQWALATDDFVTVSATALRPGKPAWGMRIRLPAGADVATLRTMLWPQLPPEVSFAEQRDDQAPVGLSEKDKVRGPLVLAGLRGRPLPFYARFTRRECCAAQRFVRAFFETADGQARLDGLERAARGDELRYGALLSDLLGREVYPSMLGKFGIPGGSRALQVGMHCMNWTHLDAESCRLWYEAEWVMRNRRKASEAREYLVYFASELGCQPAPRWAAAPARLAAGGAAEGGVAAPLAEIEVRAFPEDPEAEGPSTEVITLRIPHMTLRGQSHRFADQGWSLIPQLGMPYQVLERARGEAEALEPVMHPGRQTDELYKNPGYTLRSDRILWLYDGMLGDLPGLRCVALGIVGFVERFAQSLDINITGQEAPMLSAYEAGSFFRRHFDKTSGRSAERVLTAVYYLNRDWDASKGGALRLAPATKDFTDILPVEDSLVLFLAETVEHEVRTAHAKRRALTIWFRGSRGRGAA